MTNLEIINSLFDSYKFTQAMPEDIRKIIIRSKKEVLVGVLKKTGKYSLSTMLIINIVLLLKKFGLGVTAAKLYFITTAATLAVTGTAVVSAGVIGYSVINDYMTKAKPAPITAPAAEPPVMSNEVKTVSTPAIQYALEITPFKANPSISGESFKAAASLCGALTTISGKSAATLSKSGTDFNTKFVINGTLAKIGDKYYIGVKLVNSTNSQIVTQLNRTANGEDAIHAAMTDIAKEIAPYIKR